MNFLLTSKYQPTGDQPEAIRQLTEGLERGDRAQVLLGVTGSGKTFTVANVIAHVNKPTLILSHNKTLAAQLYEEMRGFFPDNAVEYYVSYYDYYQPEAYLPTTDVYIEKDLAINEEIDRLRLRAVSSLMSGRKDKSFADKQLTIWKKDILHQSIWDHPNSASVSPGSARMTYKSSTTRKRRPTGSRRA